MSPVQRWLGRPCVSCATVAEGRGMWQELVVESIGSCLFIQSLCNCRRLAVILWTAGRPML